MTEIEKQYLKLFLKYLDGELRNPLFCKSYFTQSEARYFTPLIGKPNHKCSVCYTMTMVRPMDAEFLFYNTQPLNKFVLYRVETQNGKDVHVGLYQQAVKNCIPLRPLMDKGFIVFETNGTINHAATRNLLRISLGLGQAGESVIPSDA